MRLVRRIDGFPIESSEWEGEMTEPIRRVTVCPAQTDRIVGRRDRGGFRDLHQPLWRVLPQQDARQRGGGRALSARTGASARLHLRLDGDRGLTRVARSSSSISSVTVVTRNDERSDAQSRPISGAHYLRLKQASDARYLRLNAQSLRQTRDHAARRTIVETLRWANR